MKYYLIYWEGNGGDSESHSVFYSELVIAANEHDAWQKWIDKNPDKDTDGRELLEMTPIN